MNDFFQHYEINTDKLVEKLRVLADEIESGDTKVKKLQTNKGIEVNEPLTVFLGIEFLTDKKELTELFEVTEE